VAEISALGTSELRGGVLILSQPAEAGWHFYAEDPDPDQAALMASTWADAFVEKTRAEVSVQSGLSSYIRVEATQVVDIPVSRSVSQSAYLFSGFVLSLVLSVGLVLFFEPAKPS
jgi:hypothetical protein